MELDVRQSIRKILSESIFNELETGTYANFMNKTSDYPWTKHLSSDKDKNTNPRHQSQKEERINKLARQKFLNAFYQEFTKDGSLQIKTNKGDFSFKAIKFNTNYTSYDLIFTKKEEDNWVTHLWINPERDGYHIDKKDVKIDDIDSDKLINQMLRYNLVKKHS